MATKNNIFEDLARVSANIAAGLFESGKNVSEGLKSRTNSFAKAADLITRDEFEVVKSMAAKIRLENENIFKDVSELRKQLQNVTSILDVLKEGISKGGGAESQKFAAELKNISKDVEARMGQFADILSKLQQRFEQPKAEVKPEPKPEAKTESKPEVKPEIKPEVKIVPEKTVAEKPTSEKTEAVPQIKPKKAANSNHDSNNDLFGNGQN